MSTSDATLYKSHAKQHEDNLKLVREPVPSRAFYFALASVIAFCLLCNALAHLLRYPEFGYMMLLAKEGIVESLGAAACLMSLWIFTVAAFSARKVPKSSTGSSASFWLFLLALFSAVMFLEEMGWGVRLWAWLRPNQRWRDDFGLAEYLLPKYSKVDVIAFDWFAAIFTYCCLFSIAARLFPSIGKAVQWARLPLPSLPLSLVWLVVSIVGMVLLFRPGLALVDEAQRAEIYESIFQILILGWAVVEISRLAKRTNASPIAAKWFAVVGTLALAAIGVDIVFRTLPMVRSQLEFRTATQRIEQGDPPDVVIPILLRTIELYPGNDAAEYALAMQLDKQNRLMESLPHFRAAVRLAPENSVYQQALGSAFLNLRDARAIPAAKFHLTRALELDPGNMQIAVQLEYIQLLMDMSEQLAAHPRWDEILAEFRRRGNRVTNPSEPKSPNETP